MRRRARYGVPPQINNQPGTYSRLAELKEEGFLHSKDIRNAKAWWLTEDSQRFLEDTDADFATDLENS